MKSKKLREKLNILEMHPSKENTKNEILEKNQKKIESRIKKNK